MTRTKTVKDFQEGQTNYTVPNGWPTSAETVNSPTEEAKTEAEPSLNEAVSRMFQVNQVEQAQRVLNDIITRNHLSLLDLGKLLQHP